MSFIYCFSIDFSVKVNSRNLFFHWHDEISLKHRSWRRRFHDERLHRVGGITRRVTETEKKINTSTECIHRWDDRYANVISVHSLGAFGKAHLKPEETAGPKQRLKTNSLERAAWRQGALWVSLSNTCFPDATFRSLGYKPRGIYTVCIGRGRELETLGVGRDAETTSKAMFHICIVLEPVLALFRHFTEHTVRHP